MNSDPRGQCLIINIRNFDKADAPLNPRPGAETDAGQLCTVHVLSCNFVIVQYTQTHYSNVHFLCHAAFSAV